MEGLDVVDTLVRIPREDSTLQKVVLESIFTGNCNRNRICVEGSPRQVRDCIIVAPMITFCEV